MKLCLKAMFREFYVWSRCKHTNIAPMLGFVISRDGIPGLVTPWCNYGSLKSYLKICPQADMRSLVS
jgi:hypothetical protein